MAGFKNGKIMLPIKEFLIIKGQATYELNTIDMTKVTVFYRKYNQEAFLETYSEMPKGDYRINEVGGNKQLEITNLDILDEYYSIQLARVVDLTSSPYSPSGQIDVITLNQHLNEVIADVTFLFTYLKDVGMVMDSSNGNKIMAELKPYTTWYMDKDGNMAAMPVDSLFEKFNDLVQELRQEVLKLLEQDLEVAERELLEEVKRQLDEYVETDLKQRLDDYTTQLEERLQTMIDQAVADKGLMPEGSDWLEIGLGNWLVVDLFNKNYIHYPPQLNSSDNAGVVKKDITDGGNSQVIRYYTTTGKMLFAVRINEVWSEWQELGGQTDTMQFTQANHGFVFTAVTLDGATRKWVKANKYTSADGIAIKIDNDRFDVVTRGVVNIPTQARDDKGEPFVYDEYYFLSQEVDGGLSRTKNEIGTFQYLAHISEIDNKQVAYIDIGDSYDLDYEVVDTETADRVGIGTYKTTLRTADTIEDLKRLNLKEGDVVEVLGYYTKGDGADHKRKIESSDDGSGVLLNNGLYANIIHNGEVNVSWLGAKGNGTDDDGVYFQKAFGMEKVLTVFYDKDYWIKSTVDVTGKNKTLKGLGQKRQVDEESGKTLYMNGGKFVNLFKILGVNAKGIDQTTDVFCEQPYCYMRYVEDCDFRGFLNVFVTTAFMGMFNMRNVSFISVKNACIKFDYGIATKMCTTSNFENVIVYTSKHFIDGDYAELVTFAFKNIVFEEMLGTPIKASIVTQCSFDNVWLEKGDTEDNKYMIITRVPQLIYTTTFNNIRRHGIWELYNVNTGGGLTFPRKEDVDQLFQFRDNRGYSTNIGGGIVEAGGAYISSDNKLKIRANKIAGYGNGTVEVGLQGGQFIISGNVDKITRQDIMKIQKSDYNISLESKDQTVSFIVNDKIFNMPQVIVFDKNSAINSNENGLCTITEKSDGIIEIDFGERWRYPAISVTVNSNEDFYVHKMKFIESYSGGWKTYGDAKAVQVTFQTTGGTLKTPERILFQLHRGMRSYKKSALKTLEENFSEQLMKDENVYDDYVSYKTDKMAYNKQLEAEEKAKQEAYQQALTSNPNLTYEEFIISYPMMLPNIEEPTIPQSVQEFMKKYL